MDVIPHSTAVGCWPIAAKDLQLLAAANCHLTYEREQIVGDAVGVLSNSSRGVSSHWIEVAQAGDSPALDTRNGGF